MFVTLLETKKKTHAMALVAPLLLAGCSSVPDALNPVEWYDATSELFTDDEQNTAQTDGAPSSVAAQDHSLPEGFIAPQGEHYAEAVNRQGQVVNALPDTIAAAPTPAVTSPEFKQRVEQAAANARRLAQENGIAPKTSTANVTSPEFKARIAESIQRAKEIKGEEPTAVATAPVAVPAAAPAPEVNSSVQVADAQTLDEIFAANVNQNRAVDPNVRMRWNIGDTYTQDYSTVVVSANGVAQQGTVAPNQQVAALSNRFSAGTTGPGVSSLMAQEPALVRAGQVQSLTAYNATAFAGTFQVATIQFRNGSSTLSRDDMKILRDVVAVHRQQGGIVRVVGHASSRTRDMGLNAHRSVNQSMSATRANTVGKALLDLGITGETLFVGGVSDSRPLYAEVMPAGEAANRRTEIFIDY